MEMIISAIAQGSIWALMGLGLFITFRILNAPDMTTESSFVLGAAVGVQTLHFNIHPFIAILLSFLAGMAGGAITGLLVTRLNINPLLSGIITMTGLYSVNLKVMGRANLSLSGARTLTSAIPGFDLPRNVDTIVIGTVFSIVVISLLSLFFKTQIGQALIATGDNIAMASSLGVQTGEMKMLGYMLANGLIALSGFLVAQDNGYADISMGIGTVVIGLASIIIGEVLLQNVSLPMRLTSIFIGSVIYRLLLTIVLALNFDTNDFKLFSAIIVGLALSIPKIQRTFRNRRYKRKAAHH